MQELILNCHLQPNAKQTQWVGRHDQAIKIRLQAPAVEGKANQALIRFLADEFGVRKKQISIISGEISRQKRVKIQQPKCLPIAVERFLEDIKNEYAN